MTANAATAASEILEKNMMLDLSGACSGSGRWKQCSSRADRGVSGRVAS